jgi:hypothetical protein
MAVAGGRGKKRVIHRFHRQMGRKMAGPKEEKSAANKANQSTAAPPPGHFLNSDLQSDTARFLAEVKAAIAERQSRTTRGALG